MDYPDLSPLERTTTLDFVVDAVLAATIPPDDVLVVSGYWRSGTTWLLQSLAATLRAKSVFEPLHPANTRTLYSDLLTDRDDLFRENFMPYGQGPFREELSDFLAKALWSRLPQFAIRQFRRTRRECFRRRIVTKVVRAHLCLPLIIQEFGTPVIHVRRDVRAIVASVAMTSWAWQFDRLSLRDHLLGVDDGRREVMEPWRDLILRYEDAGRAERIAAYWCVLERFVNVSVAEENRDSVAIVRYEDLVLDPSALVSRLLSDLGFSDLPTDITALQRDSATTSADRQGGLTASERIFGWKSRLDVSERGRIERVVEAFGLRDFLVDE